MGIYYRRIRLFSFKLKKIGIILLGGIMFLIYIIITFIIFSFVCILSNAKMEDEYLEEYFKTHERL